MHMFETASEFAFTTKASRAAAYRGPERRNATTPSIARWLSLMLDEIDFGMLLLSDEGEVMHVNHAARADLDDGHPLQMRGGHLVARDAQDLIRLQDALASASQRNLRRLLALGDGEQRVNIAVIPLGNRASIAAIGVFACAAFQKAAQAGAAGALRDEYRRLVGGSQDFIHLGQHFFWSVFGP
jgi:hypothetical protein